MTCLHNYVQKSNGFKILNIIDKAESFKDGGLLQLNKGAIDITLSFNKWKVNFVLLFKRACIYLGKEYTAVYENKRFKGNVSYSDKSIADSIKHIAPSPPLRQTFMLGVKMRICYSTKA